MLWIHSEQSPPAVRLGTPAFFQDRFHLKTGGLHNYVSTEECNTPGLGNENETNEQHFKFNRKQGASIIQISGSG